ncbi:hypothetical protein [Peribacillus simplex]|uniref:hypothetical protein n=1 Tax=Peribacillus simplex TaxID=1478 RepID=UPI0025A0D232|nr:hypothetical protein [Peribacillus simplex]
MKIFLSGVGYRVPRCAVIAIIIQYLIGSYVYGTAICPVLFIQMSQSLPTRPHSVPCLPHI